MARLKVSGIDMVLSKLTEAAQMVQSRGADAVQAGAAVLKDEMYRRHPVRTGETRDHMMVKPSEKIADGYQSVITWNGKDAHGTRYAAIAYINEYGRKSQRAQPFIRPAQVASEEQVQQAMMEVLTEGL